MPEGLMYEGMRETIQGRMCEGMRGMILEYMRGNENTEEDQGSIEQLNSQLLEPMSFEHITSLRPTISGLDKLLVKTSLLSKKKHEEKKSVNLFNRCKSMPIKLCQSFGEDIDDIRIRLSKYKRNTQEKKKIHG